MEPADKGLEAVAYGGKRRGNRKLHQKRSIIVGEFVSPPLVLGGGVAVEQLPDGAEVEQAACIPKFVEPLQPKDRR